MKWTLEKSARGFLITVTLMPGLLINSALSTASAVDNKDPADNPSIETSNNQNRLK